MTAAHTHPPLADTAGVVARHRVERRRLVLLGLLGGLSCATVACRAGRDRPPGTGEAFPAVELPTIDGHRASLADHRGAALVLNFWATWCGPCRHEMPGLQRLSSRFDPRELRVVGVSVDTDLDLVREFRLAHGLTFPLWSDRDRRLSDDLLGIAAFPTTYLVTKDHSIAAVVVGERDWADDAIQVRIESLLGVHGAQRRSPPATPARVDS